LFKQQSVLRNSKTRGAAREKIASDVEGRVRAGCWWDGGNTSDTLTKCGANGAQRMPDKDNFGAVLQPIANTLGSRGVRSHTELDGHGAYIPVAIQGNLIGRDKGGPTGVGASTDGAMYTMTKADVHGVAVDTLHQQGYNANYASTEEANAVETLRVLQQEIGEEAFTAWGFGILDSLQPTKVLRSRLHGAGIRCATFSRSWAVYCAISREKNRAAGALQSVQEAEGKGCSPSGRELPEQLAEQLGAYLSQLSQPGTQFERLMHHLRCACKGVGILRQALSAIQETQRPVDVEGQTPTAMMVRRLTPIECEFLQGFPRDYTLIPWRKKAADDCPDGPRYKALGNSMAVNCMEWIGERIAAFEAGEDA
jgi:DNA (cytosine-5)-methyltransferase 1